MIDGFTDVFTVQSKGECVTDVCILEQFIFGVVEVKTYCWRSVVDIIYIFHSFKFLHPFWSTATTGVDGTVCEGVEDGVLIVHDLVVDGLQVYIFCIPVLIVFNEDQFRVVGPGFEFEWTIVYHVGSFCTIAFTVLFYDVLTLWHHNTGIGQSQEVWGWAFQSEFDCFVVNCFYAQFGRVHLACQNCVCIFNTGQQPGVWRTGFWCQNTGDCINIVVCCYRLSIAPFVVAQMEGPNSTIFVGFPRLSSSAFTNVLAVFFSQSGQWFHSIGQNAGAVSVVTCYAVQSGWLTAQITIKVLFCIQNITIDGFLFTSRFSSCCFFAAASCHGKHHCACHHNCQDFLQFHDNFSFRAYQTLSYFDTFPRIYKDSCD